MINTPEVTFKRITLSNSSNLNPNLDNPHFNESKEVIYGTTFFGKFDATQKVSYEETVNEPMRVDVELAIRESNNSSEYRKLLGDNFYKKYFHIKVISADTSQKVDDILSILTFGKNTRRNPDGTKEEKTLTDVSFNTKNLYLKESDFVETVGKFGEYVIRVSFEFNQNPSYLSFFAIPYIDFQALEEDFEAEFNLDLINSKNLRFAAENVIKNNNVVSLGYIFEDSNNLVWTGGVELRGDSFFKIGTEEVLTAQSVPNNTVQDFRSLNKPQGFEFNQNKLLYSINNLFEKKSYYEPSFESKKTFFSELYLTVDKKINSRSLFYFDVISFMMDKGRFNFLLSRNLPSLNKDIVSMSPIRSLRVFRERVREVRWQTYSGTFETAYKPYEGDEGKTLVCVATQGESSIILPTTRTADKNNDGVADTDIGNLREIVTQQDRTRCFTFTDFDISKETDGIYRYFIELDIEDGTVNKMIDYLSSVRDMRKNVEKHKQFIEDSGFDVRTGVFTQKTSDDLNKLYSENFESAPWNVIPLKFVLLLEEVFNFQDTSLFRMYKKGLSPNGNILLVNSLIDAISLVENQIERMIRVGSTSVKTSTAEFKSVISKKESGESKAVQTVSHTFKSVVDSNLKKNIGLEYLEFIGDDNSKAVFLEEEGLNIITGEDYLKRTNAETLKYFNTSEYDFSLSTDRKTYLSSSLNKNALSYLSPSSLQGSSSENLMIRKSFDSQAGFKNSLKISTVNDFQNSAYESLDVKSQTTTNDVLASNFPNISIIESGPAQTTEGDSVLAKDILGDSLESGNKQQGFKNKPKTSTLQAMSVGLASIFSISKKKVLNNGFIDKKAFMNALSTKTKASNFDLKSTNNSLESKSDSSIADLPNQIASIFLGSVGDKKVLPNQFVTPQDLKVPNINAANEPSFNFNYGLIKKIEVLDSFDVSVINPIWKKLTVEHYNSNLNKELVCRVSNYEDFSLQEEDTIVFNSYFILRPQSIVTQVEVPILPEQPEVEQILKNFASQDEVSKTVSTNAINTGIFNFE